MSSIKEIADEIVYLKRVRKIISVVAFPLGLVGLLVVCLTPYDAVGLCMLGIGVGIVYVGSKMVEKRITKLNRYYKGSRAKLELVGRRK